MHCDSRLTSLLTSALLLAALPATTAFAAGSTAAPESSPPSPAGEDPAPLTLAGCVQRALLRNFDIELGHFDTANSREAVTIASAAFDPSLRASSSRSGTRVDGAPSASSTWANRIGVSQHIATGADVSVSTSLDRSGNRLSSPYNPAYDSDVSLTLSQPLLKGAGLAYNRSAIARARLGVDRTSLLYRSTMMDTVRDTEVAYYQLHFARQQLSVRRQSLAAARLLYEENKTKRDTGVLTDLEVLTAEVGVATQQRNVLLAEQELHDREDGLRSIIGQFELDSPLGGTGFSLPEVEPLDVARTFERAKTAQPEYLASKTTIDQLQIDADSARRNRLPELNLATTLGYNAERAHPGSALENLPGSDGYNWQVGVELVYPIGSRGDRARLAQAVNTLGRARLQLHQLEQNILVQTRSSVRAVVTNREAVQVSALASHLGVKQYDLEKARFDAGLSTARRVLDAQTDLDTARVNEISSQVALLTSLAQLRRLEGRTLESYAIDAPPPR
jgi:outer membrane protein TolC